jgi:serine/threonine protein kinase
MESAYEALSLQRPSGTGPDRGERTTELVCPTRIGRYEIARIIGRGGTSLVLEGRDPDLGRQLAIKVIDSHHAADGELARRFLDEARLCSQLPHPGIVPIYDIGRCEDGRPYFTMKLVVGETFAAQLAARESPAANLQQHLETFARVCETVAFAHASGVVHGDLKPGNVMVGAFGQVQVMDWGFSRRIDEASRAATAGAPRPCLMGTPPSRPRAMRASSIRAPTCSASARFSA